MNRSLFICMAFLSCIIYHNVITSHNIKTDDYQQINSNNAGISFNSNNTPMYFLDVITKELKKPTYPEILASDFTYLNQLLHYGNQTHKDHTYVRSILNIFSKLLGGSPVVNAYAFNAILAEFPHQLKPYFTHYKAQQYLKSTATLQVDLYDRFRESVNNALYLQFNTHYEFFKNNPEQFLDDVTQQIVDITQEEIDNERIRFSLARFIDIGLSKLIWHPEEHEKIWPNVKTIAKNLESLLENNILHDIDDLDNSFWILIHRFNYFIDMFSIDLPDSFFENIKNDIAQNTILLLDLEEDDSILSKKECLDYYLFAAEAKSRAYQSGILTR